MPTGLQAIFEAQKELCERYGVPLNLLEKIRGGPPEGDPISISAKGELAHWHEKIALSIMMEGSELLDWSPWKHWSARSGNKMVDPKNLYSEGHIKEIKIEIVDLFHFIVEMALVFGMTPEDLEREYFEKNQVNHDRKDNTEY